MLVVLSQGTRGNYIAPWASLSQINVYYGNDPCGSAERTLAKNSFKIIKDTYLVSMVIPPAWSSL
jgi:hypothetical protein